MNSESSVLTYYQRNRDVQLPKARAYREAHRDKYQEYWRDYYSKNKEQLKAKRREYARKHRLKINERNRELKAPKFYTVNKSDNKSDNKEESERLILSPQDEVPRWSMVITEGTVVTFD